MERGLPTLISHFDFCNKSVKSLASVIFTCPCQDHINGLWPGHGG
jgi:hypothetical protein